VKLLRVLEEKQVQRLGATRPIDVDVRFVAATHRDLEAMVEKGQFRADLLYRLNVVPVHLPPLRERREDIELLVRHFSATFARENRRPTLLFAAGAFEVLRAHPWPGNVRELANLVERLVLLSEGEPRRRFARGELIGFVAERPQDFSHRRGGQMRYLFFPFLLGACRVSI